MKKIHYGNSGSNTNFPYCANRIYMKVFNTTENKNDVTCKLCLMRLGILPERRGNWNARSK